MIIKSQSIKRIIVLIILIAFSMVTVSCNRTERRIPGPAKEVDARLIEANTRFAMKLYKELLDKEQDKNLFISPTSIAIALAMTYNGADGTTKEAMAKALEMEGLSLEDLNNANKDLISILNNPDPSIELTVANSLWARQDIGFHEDFLKRNKDNYNASIEKLDFSKPNAVDIINKWVKDNTKGKIDEIVEAPIDPLSILFLINAIYFKGDWTYKFDKKDTTELPFHMIDGTQKKHPMMKQSGNFAYQKGDNFQSISLPYGKDERFSMNIFLPDEGISIKDFNEQLNFENWSTWMDSYGKMDVDIVLPKFNFEYEIQLNSTLKALGMEVAFNPSEANFDNLFSEKPIENAYISEVKHKSYIDVNEEGAEAAAVTSVEIRLTSLPEKLIMVMDRPFFFAIVDNETAAVLFMGTVKNP